MISDSEWRARFPNFTKTEIYSPETISTAEHVLCLHAMEALQDLRRAIQKPLIVNFGPYQLRGVRSAAENARIPNFSPQSMHVYARAFDITVHGMSTAELFDFVTNHDPRWRGLGLYPTWLHIDRRASTELIIWDRR